ncbi:MAG: hypothetical protein A2X61_08420 [Ignavibacteria bacterium GWB2_35_12]|nr:MAG: hypothetical protein A2X63_02310 [Ignavibacteria bacterium GWA2_35_8]OGU40180.1 MAG: hypothetical protein A2X61_08420 [Ignavibacteria bacterium GWB2_35_12]OGU92374.1 MAG: hypothetical protein A2220_16865 [Ignavibacteria bacterium RIFOXYA2_FULL_35_10]OGV22335.1 MAG: hypothetical protein A2475_15705 [Ignavibacteria bacterium RIFOXYC2_FULL_35_21]
MKRLDIENINWYLFNLYGLQIEDQDNWRDFIFDDATIVNAKQLKEYLEEIQYDERPIIHYLFSHFKSEHTFLIVQNYGKIVKENEKELQAQAEKRALEVSGFIFFVFLFLSDFRIGISLDSQIYGSQGSEINLLTSYKSQSTHNKYTAGEYSISIPDEPLRYSRTKLINLFNKIQFKRLYYFVKTRNDKNINESLSNLYLTLNVPSPITQLLGAITSIEILLKDDMKYDRISERINTMLGEKIYKDFVETSKDKIGVLKKRHNVIHQGEHCTDKDAYSAIVVSSYIIIVFSHLVHHFPTKSKICKHLDIIHKIQKDKDLTLDIFGIIEKWEAIKFDLTLIDWTVQRLIYYFGLCNSKKKEVTKDSFTQAIVWHSKVRNNDLETSYNLIKNSLYYNVSPINSFDELTTYYEENKINIDEEINKSERWHKFIV